MSSNRLSFFSVLVGFAALTASCSNSEVSEQTKPNIIFIYADDWGYGDLSCHGSTFCLTPNLDKMADEGIDFQNFAVCNPVCSPSRTAIMTGHFPARHSVHGHFASVESHMNRGMPDWLDPDEVMLPRLLKEAGYTTAHYGKWHLSNNHVPDGPSPLEYGYDDFDAFNVSSRFTQMSADSTMTRTINFIEKNKDKPFFVNVWIHATHTPHYPKENFLAQFPELNEQQKVYAAVIAEADYKIGLLFDKLKELGIDEKTLVIFSSDNGPEIKGPENNKLRRHFYRTWIGNILFSGETSGLKGQKRSLFAGGIRTPFIVRWPGVVPPGIRDRTTPIAAVDLLPSFVELAGGTLPSRLHTRWGECHSGSKGEPFKRKSVIYWQWLYPGNRT